MMVLCSVALDRLMHIGGIVYFEYCMEESLFVRDRMSSALAPKTMATTDFDE